MDGSRIDSGDDYLSVISELVTLADLVLLCSISSLTCYILLLFPTSLVRTPLFSILCFAFGYGPAPLLLVIIAPFLTEHISTALGLHKSFEMSGSTLMQTVQQIYSVLNSFQGAGFLLDFESRTPELVNPATFRETHVIWIFTALNTLYVISILLLLRLDRKSNLGNIEHAKLHDIKEGYKVLEQQSSGDVTESNILPARIARSKLQVWRVRIYIGLGFVVLLATWISFGVVMGYRRS